MEDKNTNYIELIADVKVAKTYNKNIIRNNNTLLRRVEEICNKYHREFIQKSDDIDDKYNKRKYEFFKEWFNELKKEIEWKEKV